MTPLTTMRARSMPRSKYRRLLAVLMAAQERSRASGVTERHRGPCRGAEREERRGAGGDDERVQIVGERPVDGDALDFALQDDEPRRVKQTADVTRRVDVPVEHQAHLD